MLYCSVRHPEVHEARNGWRNSLCRMVPGHEIGGRVVKVGAQSMVRGMVEAQEMLDFCGRRNIVSDVEMIGVDEANEA